MAKKILIFGRTGAGKTALANALAPLVGGVVFDGDVVRGLDLNPIGFSPTDRWRHARRMSGLCDLVTAAGNIAIASFVCPTASCRKVFDPDFTVWIDRNGDQKYPDTNTLFEDPSVAGYDVRCTNAHPPEYWAAQIASMLREPFNPLRKTALFVGRYQPFHAGHKALIEEGIKKHGQVCIGVRDQNRDWPFERVKQIIDFALRNHVGKYTVVALPNITAVCYGRDVGYSIEQLHLPPPIEAISATNIRKLTGAP